MGKYYEVLVDPSHTFYEKMTANGHDFEVFFEYLGGAKEWYAGIVGTLPKHLEPDHKKPQLIGRGPTKDDCRDAARSFLEATFPAWSDKQWADYKAEIEAAEAEARAEEEAKKKAAAEAKKAAG